MLGVTSLHAASSVIRDMGYKLGYTDVDAKGNTYLEFE
jgi:hypothetical protein